MQTLLKRQQQKKTYATPFVSVVCPTWNRRAFLPYLLYLSLIHISVPTRH